jgi:hypothetical protein
LRSWRQRRVREDPGFCLSRRSEENHEVSLDRDRWRRDSRRHGVPDTLHRRNRSDANRTGSRSLRTHCDHACDTAAELSNPVSPAEDERDNLINVLPHAQFLGNEIYEFLPALSRGNGVPIPTLRAEYTTVELNQGAGRAFEAALAAEQSKLQGEALWYRMVVGGNTPCYVRLRPRASLAAILDERASQALPGKVDGLISKLTVETLNLRPNMLVNVTAEPAR